MAFLVMAEGEAPVTSKAVCSLCVCGVLMWTRTTTAEKSRTARRRRDGGKSFAYAFCVYVCTFHPTGSFDAWVIFMPACQLFVSVFWLQQQTDIHIYTHTHSHAASFFHDLFYPLTFTFLHYQHTYTTHTQRAPPSTTSSPPPPPPGHHHPDGHEKNRG